MNAMQLLIRGFRASLLIICVLALNFSGLGSRPALARVVGVHDANIPAGLNPTDWGKIKALLPATESDLPPIQQTYFKASNAQADELFGFSVAVDGNTAVVGAPCQGCSGTVYVFTRSDGVWSQQGYLKASNSDLGDGFGISVAISGDTLVVGAYAEDSSAAGINGDQADGAATNSGAAYVFTRSGTTWSQQAYLKASNPGAGDWFGFPVAISGDTIVAGAQCEASNASGIDGDQSDNSLACAGAAYVFTRSGNTWSQQAYLKSPASQANDYFGNSVAIDGDTLAVGAPGASDDGAAYIFTRSGSTWSQQAQLSASNAGARDAFGWSLALNADTLVVGAINEDSQATGVDGDQANNSASNSGAAYVFTRSVKTWSQQAYLKASNTGTGDYFGYAVTISGDTLVVGAPHESSNSTGVNGDQANNLTNWSGAAYVFQRSGGAWSQEAYLKASNTGSFNEFEFGYGLALQADTLLVGSPQESGGSTGINGNQADYASRIWSGAAYQFILPGSGTPTNNQVLKWNTFLGTEGYRSAMALDGAGNLYITGDGSANWGTPTRNYTGLADNFVAKLDPSGNLLWSTFLGGSGYDYAGHVAVDGHGNVYVAGESDATWGNPIRAFTPGSDTSFEDTFVARLDAADGSLTWNTFLGGSGDDEIGGLAVDESGKVYVSGTLSAQGSDSPSWGAPVRPYNPPSGSYHIDAFAAKLDPDGALVWNTFLGGSADDFGTGIALEQAGGLVLTGYSSGTWGSLQPQRYVSGGNNAFVAGVDTADGSLTWNTFLGGEGASEGQSIAVDASGSIFVTGISHASWGSPLRAYTPGISGYEGDAFVAKLDPFGWLFWNTFLGGVEDDMGRSIAPDGSGNVYVTGDSWDGEFGYDQIGWGDPLRAFTGRSDAFVALLDAGGHLTTNLFLGGSGDATGGSIAVDRHSNIFVTGSTYTDPNDLPGAGTWGNPILPYDDGGHINHGFVAKLNIYAAAPTVDIFAANSASQSLNIPITGFTASDDLAVTGYEITTSANPPAIDDSGWSGTAPTTYTVGGEGLYTLYPWAKDADGNISAVYSSPVRVLVELDTSTPTAAPTPASTPTGTPTVAATPMSTATPTTISTLPSTPTEIPTATATPMTTATPTTISTLPSTPTRTPTVTATATAIATSLRFTRTFGSAGANDGWVLESSEKSSRGGSLNSTATTFQLGDDAAKRQYRVILSFNTNTLPAGATIQSAALLLRQSGAVTGSNPFNILGSLWADIRHGNFGTSALQLADFNSAASLAHAGAFNKTPSGGWYTDTLNPAGLAQINRSGPTQFRLYFATDDNNNRRADYMKFSSGNSTTNRPQLVITYTLP